MPMAEMVERDAEAPPDDGLELLPRVALAILDGADPRAIARQFRMRLDRAQELHAEVFRQVYQRTEELYGRDRLKANKHALVQKLNKGIDVCMAEMEETRSSRPLARMTAAIKVLCSMEGHNAPTQTVNTDIRVHASVQPKDMDRVMANPRARAAMIAFEEAVSDSIAEPVTTIDVTPPDPEGGGE